jgi:hypothetical protein
MSLEPSWIETESATEVLKALPPNGRAEAARVLWRKMEGSANGADALWRERVGPWLNDAWPRSPELRDRAVSTHLAMATLQADAEFPAAVNLILEMIDHGNISLVAWELERVKTKHAREHPFESLKLLAALLDSRERHYDRNLPDGTSGDFRGSPRVRKYRGVPQN